MATASVNTFLRRLTRGMAAESLRDYSDPQLVERLLAGGDAAAFEAVVRRHGPMVYRVCWRVLQHPEDTEDAFQATFLIAAQRLRTVRRHASLASWLHGIAHRVALKARGRAATRRRRERSAAERVPPDDVTWRELRAVLDAELGRLPEKWRAPLVLCYLEGRTQDEAARQLGLSPRTLRRRLEEAKAALGRRLTGRGVVWPAALAAVLLSESMAPAALAPRLVDPTVEAAVCLVTGRAALPAAVPARVAALTEGELKTMFASKLKAAAAALVLLAAVAVGAGGLLYQARATEPQQPPQAQRPAAGEGEKPRAAPRPVVVKEKAQLVQVAWGADGKTVATLGYTFEVVESKADPAMPRKVSLSSHTVKLWDAATGKLALSLGEEKDTMVQSLAFSHDRKTAALVVTKMHFDREKGEPTGPSAPEVRVLDARTWELKHKFSAASDNEDLGITVGALAVSPDGKTLALSGSPRQPSDPVPEPKLGAFEPPACLRLWDVGKKKLLDRKPKRGEKDFRLMYCVAFSPDGKVIAAGDKEGKIRLFDGRTGEPKAVLDDHTAAVHGLAFSPDGKTLASASQDHTIKLWDVAGRKLRHTLQKDKLWAVAFSPDGKRLATGGGVEQEQGKWRYEIILWDAKTGEMERTLPVELTTPAWSLAFSPDGRTLAVAGGNLGDAKDGAKTSGELGLIPLR